MCSQTNVTVSYMTSDAPAFMAEMSSFDGHAFSNQYLATGVPSAWYMMTEQLRRAAAMFPLRTISCHSQSSMVPGRGAPDVGSGLPPVGGSVWRVGGNHSESAVT